MRLEADPAGGGLRAGKKMKKNLKKNEKIFGKVLDRI